MKGISTVLVVVLILLITVFIAVLAYTFLTETFTGLAETGEAQAEDVSSDIAQDIEDILGGGGISPSVCGDGYLNEGIGEECDDGNLIDNDGCDSNCMIEADCGNGIIETGEVCDGDVLCHEFDPGYQNNGESAICSGDCSGYDVSGCTPIPTTEICDNGIDDDSDSFTDCLDSDCIVDPYCSGEDFDGDEWTNLEEISAGTDPSDPNDHPIIDPPSNLAMRQISGSDVKLVWFIPYDPKIIGYKIYLDGTEIADVIGPDSYEKFVPLPTGWESYNWIVACDVDTDEEYSNQAQTFTTIDAGQAFTIYSLKTQTWDHPGTSTGGPEWTVNFANGWNSFGLRGQDDIVDYTAENILNIIFAITADPGLEMIRYTGGGNYETCFYGVPGTSFDVVPDEGYFISTVPVDISFQANPAGAQNAPLSPDWNFVARTAFSGTLDTTQLDSSLGARMDVPGYSIRAYDSGNRLSEENVLNMCG